MSGPKVREDIKPATARLVADLEKLCAYLKVEHSLDRRISSKLAADLEEARAYLASEDLSTYELIGRKTRIDVRRIREELGMRQNEFAIHFGISVKTLRNWEQGLREPEGPARAYLTVIKNDPQAVLRALDADRPEVEATPLRRNFR